MTKPAESELVIIETESMDYVSLSQDVDILDQQSLERGVDLVQRIKVLSEDVDETFDPHIAALHKQHKDLLATKKRFVAPLIEAEILLKAKLGNYVDANPSTKAKGMSTRESVSIEIDDLKKLITSAGRGSTPLEVVKPDLVKIKQLALAGFKVPGTIIKRIPIISIRK